MKGSCIMEEMKTGGVGGGEGGGRGDGQDRKQARLRQNPGGSAVFGSSTGTRATSSRPRSGSPLRARW